VIKTSGAKNLKELLGWIWNKNIRNFNFIIYFEFHDFFNYINKLI
jgi:hypothetical protein